MKLYNFFKPVLFLLIFVLAGCSQYDIIEPNVTLSADKTNVAVEEDVAFVAEGLATHYVIYFGDGGQRTFNNVDAPIVYAYSSPGTYEVYIDAVMADRNEQKSSKSNTVTITVSE